LLVSVAEGTTDGLGEANLLTRLEEVLSLEDIFGSELTKVLIGGHLAGEEGGGETGTLVHATTDGIGGGRSGGWAVRRSRTKRRVFTLNDGVARLRVHVEEKKNECSHGEEHNNILVTTLF
tara:strand:- start:313 stop:675 length:363 start_codon:yes stop_codon:yes gene_type:complete